MRHEPTTPTLDTHPNLSIFPDLVRIQIRRFSENKATHFMHYASKRVDFPRPASTKTMGYELWQRKKSMSIYWLPMKGRKRSGGPTPSHGDTWGQARHRLPHPQNVTWSSGYSLQCVLQVQRQPSSVIIGVETANPRSKPAGRPLDRKRRIRLCAVP
jgi:hypothetical protein